MAKQNKTFVRARVRGGVARRARGACGDASLPLVDMLGPRTLVYSPRRDLPGCATSANS